MTMAFSGSEKTTLPPGSRVTESTPARGAVSAGLPSPPNTHSVPANVVMVPWAERVDATAARRNAGRMVMVYLVNITTITRRPDLFVHSPRYRVQVRFRTF